jgi:hypothetical protein
MPIMTANTTNRHDNSVCPYFLFYTQRISQINPDSQKMAGLIPIISVRRVRLIPYDTTVAVGNRPTPPLRKSYASCTIFVEL